MRFGAWAGLICLACGAGPAAHAALADARATIARGAIEDSERRQREVLAHLYTLDQSIKSTSKRSLILKRRASEYEIEARSLGREVNDLERRGAERGRQMNRRLSSLFRRRAGSGALRAMFAAESPGQIDQHQRFLRLMINDDQRQLEMFLEGLREARERRQKLARAVRRLMIAQHEVRANEVTLAEQRGEKERLVARISARRDTHLDELRTLRREGLDTDLAFFERRGALENPVPGPVTRVFGLVNDPGYNFKLMHKGWFYGGSPGTEISAIAGGRVEVARDLPGWGPTVVVDHGEHYHSVYACASRIKVREGDQITAGQPIAFTGERSPLFGPGLYFELRHFADAIDPNGWIKDPNFTVRPAQRE